MFYKNGIQFKYKEVVGYSYHNEGNTKAIIYCSGGPSMGDGGSNKFWSDISSKLGITVLIPDYIGAGRSAGKICNVESCCKTVAICEELLLENKEFVNCWANKIQKYNIKKVFILGHSWGGTMAAIYFKFFPNSKIKDVALVAGALDYNVNGHLLWGGESDIEFWEQLLNGWENYYRDIKNSNWKDLVFNNTKDLNPLDNVKYLANINIYLIHGKNDKIISYIRTEHFFNRLMEIKELNKTNNTTTTDLKIYKKNHGTIMCNETINYLKNIIY